MGLGIFKKKEKLKEDSLPPPPPPMPMPAIGDIEPIRPSEAPPVPAFSVPEDFIKKKTGAPIIEEKEDVFIEKEFPASMSKEEFEKPVEVPEFEEDKGPFFVSLSDHEKIERDVKSMETLLDEAEDNLESLHETIDIEEKMFEKWRSFLEGVEKKLTFVDKIIAKAGE